MPVIQRMRVLFLALVGGVVADINSSVISNITGSVDASVLPGSPSHSAVLTFAFQAVGNTSDLPVAKQEAMATIFAVASGVDPSNVTVTIQDGAVQTAIGVWTLSVHVQILMTSVALAVSLSASLHADSMKDAASLTALLSQGGVDDVTVSTITQKPTIESTGGNWSDCSRCKDGNNQPPHPLAYARGSLPAACPSAEDYI